MFNTSAPWTHAIRTYHVIVLCLYIDHFVCIVFYRIEVEPEPEITPPLKIPCTTHVSKASKPPLIMSIKSHFPLSPAYALFRMITMITFLPHRWTHSFAWPINCHSSRQTTILATVGVDWYHVAPAIVTAYCMLRVIPCWYCYVSRDGSDHDNVGGKVLVNLP